jgi:DNA-binding TFAR19-related protein (PDSD5 family)
MLELQKVAAVRKKAYQKSRSGPLDVQKILGEVFVGRAWEVFHNARAQFPAVMEKIASEMARLISEGKLKGPISGEQLLWFLRSIGLDVRMKTRIQYYESGELKSLADKLKGR